MITLREIQKACHSLFIHRLRSLLSTLGILFGVAAVIAMLSIGEGAKQETLEQISQLGMKNILIRTTSDEKENEWLTWKDIDLLRQNIPFLIYIAPVKNLKGSIQGNKVKGELISVNRSFGEIKSLRLTEGRFICDLDRQEKVCVLGYEIARSLGKDGHIGKHLRIDHNDFNIVGILNPTLWKPIKNSSMNIRNLDYAVMIPFGLETIFQNTKSSKNFTEIILQIEDSAQMETALSLVKKVLSKLHGRVDSYQFIVPQELLRQAADTQRTFNLVLGSIAAISLLVGGIGIMNIMLATVSERTREIGIRRAVGANQKDILKQFLSETLLLTLIGAIAGISLGIALSLSINHFAGWKTIVTPWSIVISLFMSTVVGLCSGLYPAYLAAKMDPIKALKNLD